MPRSAILLYTSLGLFLVSFTLPALDMVPWIDGWAAFGLSFVGLVLSLPDSPNHFVASVLGVSANVIMLVVYFKVGKNRCQRGTAVAATVAATLTVLVPLPLNAIMGRGHSPLISQGWQTADKGRIDFCLPSGAQIAIPS